MARRVARGVDVLIGKSDEVAWAHDRLDRNEKATCRSLEDRDADRVANAEGDLLRRPPVGSKEWTMVGAQVARMSTTSGVMRMKA